MGDLDRFTFADFVARISSLIHPQMQLVLDLSQLQFIDSTGLGALRAVSRRVRRRGGRVFAQNPSTRVAELLSMSGLDEVIQQRRPHYGFNAPRQPAS
jgi:anti-sigma B factor antagonist